MQRTLRLRIASTPHSKHERFLSLPLWRRSGVSLISARIHYRTLRSAMTYGHLELTQVCEEASDLSRGSSTPEPTAVQSSSGIFHNFFAFWNTLFHRIHSDVQSMDLEVVNSQIRQTVRHAKLMTLVMPFASASSGVQSLIIITRAISSFISVYLLLLFLRVLLSWFPTFQWDRNPWIILRQVTDPYLNLFRGLIPPFLGTIDFTPLLGFIILQWLSGNLVISDDETYW